MAKSGLKHIDVGPELSKTEWESEDSHELVHGASFPGSPVERQLFYRDDEHKWYIYNGSVWVWLGGGSGGGGGSKIQDADGDTSWDVEQSADEDKIHGKVKGVEAFLLDDAGVLTLAKQSTYRVYRNADQSIPTGVWTKVAFDAESWDTQNEFDPTTNYRFTAKTAGKYAFVGCAVILSATTGALLGLSIRKNGDVDPNSIGDNYTTPGAAGNAGINILAVADLAVNDYLALFFYHACGSTKSLAGGSRFTNFAVTKLA